MRHELFSCIMASVKAMLNTSSGAQLPDAAYWRDGQSVIL